MIRSYNKCNCGKIYHPNFEHCPHCGLLEQWSDGVFLGSNDYVYDIETYPNIFTLAAEHVLTGTKWLFEISEWVNEIDKIRRFLGQLKKHNARLVGFNNVNFDWPVTQMIMTDIRPVDVTTIYNKAIDIIFGDSFAHRVWDPLIEQVDLFLIHHFNNKARRVGLKELQFNMRSKSVEDLPYEPGTILTYEQAQELKKYNHHDVEETTKFYFESVDAIKYREQLNKKYINYNDTKIGKKFLIDKLQDEHGIQCYERVYHKGRSNNQPVQSRRDKIALNDLILPEIKFYHDEFNRILDYFKSQVITETKGVFKGLSCTVDGFDYHFGTGGIHGSIDSRVVRTDEHYQIIDIDVKSYYPNIAIANNLYPEHLGKDFCSIYSDLYRQRQQYDKSQPENEMLKLALNGVYGDSNNKYSPFYDPKYTMSITINGQLLLCMLSEWLRSISGLTMVQINTDGLTVRVPHCKTNATRQICAMWEKLTGLTLEYVDYKIMYIRDVNNYIAVDKDGDIKRKGCYAHDRNNKKEVPWHKDQSMLIVPMAAEAELLYNTPAEEFIKRHKDPFDFMKRTKPPRSNKVMHGDQEQQRVTRYYISKFGKPLTKIAPPPKGYKIGQWKRKNGISDQLYNQVIAEVGDEWDARIHTKSKTKYKQRVTNYEKGWLTSICNDVNQFSFDNVNYDYYISQARAIIDCLANR